MDKGKGKGMDKGMGKGNDIVVEKIFLKTKVFKKGEKEMNKVVRVGIERWGSVREEVEWVGMVEDVVNEIELKIDEVVKKDERGWRGREKKEYFGDLKLGGVIKSKKMLDRMWNEYDYDEKLREVKFSGEDRWLRIDDVDERMEDVFMFL